MTRRSIVLTLTLAIVIGVAGFFGVNWFLKERDGTVGLVDIEKVSAAMGWTDEMRKSVVQSQTKYQRDVEAYLKPFRDACEHEREKIRRANNLSADDIKAINNAKQRSDLEKLKLTPAQIDALTKCFESYNAESNMANGKMNQALQSQQTQVQNFSLACWESAKPAVRRIAAAGHKTVVLSPQGSVLYSDPAVDLTDKVIDELQHSTQPKVTFPEPPRLDLRSPPPASTQP